MDRLLVLGWHNVEGSWFFPCRPGAGRRGLERQFAFLKRYTNVVSLDDGLRALSKGWPLPPRAVTITFDDGYRDQLELAVPMLKRLALPAAFFLVPGFLSGLAQPWWEVLAWAFASSTRHSVNWQDTTILLRNAAERRSSSQAIAELLKRRSRTARDQAVEQLTTLCEPSGEPGVRQTFLDWDEARELVRQGFTVASHSLRHSILSKEEGEEQRRDLVASREQLEHELQVPVRLLAYPNGRQGDYDQLTIDAAKAAGYTYAVTTIPGWNRPMTPRYEILRFVQLPERGAAGLAVIPLHSVRRAALGLRPRPRA